MAADKSSETSSTAPADAAPVATVDLTSYRTEGLAAQLTELLSVPGAFRKVALTMLLVAALAAAACVLIGQYAAVARLPLLAICIYSLAASIGFGILLGIVRIVAAALQNIEQLLGTTLQLTTQVAKDYEQVQAGGARLPSGGELVSQVYGGIVMPVVEQVVAGIGSRIRFYALAPIYALFVAAFGLGTLPVFAAVYFFGGS